MAAQQRRLQALGGTVIRQEVVELLPGPAGSFRLLLSNGREVAAGKVILAQGSQTKFSSLAHRWTGARQPNLSLRTQTVAFLRLGEEEASRLGGLPTMVTSYTWGGLDGTYILPPIRYPDGQFYLKLGHGDHYERGVETEAELRAWYQAGSGDPAAVQELAAFIQTLLPGLQVEQVTGGCCVTANTQHRAAPVIDTLAPGLVMLAGGCGYG